MVKQQLISSSKYSVKCPYAMIPEGIIIHNTANDASAQNEARYMENNNNSTSYHIVVDDIEALQVIPFNRNSWNAGDGSNGAGNRKYISLEICYSKSGGDRFEKAENNAVRVVSDICKTFGWTIKNIKMHKDFSNTHCPHRTFELGWNRFLEKINLNLETDTDKEVIEEVYLVRVINTDKLNIRKTADTKHDPVGIVNRNEVYTIVETKGTWGKLKSGAGWISLNYTEKLKEVKKAEVGCKVKIIGSNYVTGQAIPNWVKSNVYTIREIDESKVLIAEIMSWVYIKDIIIL